MIKFREICEKKKYYQVNRHSIVYIWRNWRIYRSRKKYQQITKTTQVYLKKITTTCRPDSNYILVKTCKLAVKIYSDFFEMWRYHRVFSSFLLFFYQTESKYFFQNWKRWNEILEKNGLMLIAMFIQKYVLQLLM